VISRGAPRPLDTGDLEMAHWLEGAGLLMIGLGGQAKVKRVVTG
jgi:predicted dinucleotide-binding enzyme